ncbi:acetyl-CoA synthetase-like protein [Aspergillus steynii IBT 23096]|uniref:Acetyl-CoA synthetase-like protein n=1 Tax=Aspergillus steynii IBT 23096 TaxID=1392250 RepID=A0A2I2GKP2_9EURO|nr:acetyl-CoA synthetase-like protein [Aspergillus steynii IBT 23096]PLB53450.1 acetyl-CoA synthetase-like protein [Aspergillus steynii IBT 23096]
MGSLGFEPRLLPHALDQEAIHNPDRLFCIHSVSLKSLDNGWRRVTIGELAHAVNSFAWWIEKNVASRASPQRLVYIGPADIRYSICVLACMKLGHCLLLLSPNTSDSVINCLLKSGRCSRLLFAPEYAEKVQRIRSSNKSLQAWQVMGLWEMFDVSSEPFPYCPEYTLAKEREPTVILYSSGTTGLPKEIPFPHGYFTALDYFQHIPLPPGRKSTAPWLNHDENPHLLKTSLSHGSGIVTWGAAIFHRTLFVIGPDIPMTGELLEQIVTETGAKSGLFLPDTLTNLSSSPEGMKAMARLDCVSFVGMPLPTSVGDKISRITRLQSSIGLTETAYFCTIRPEDPKHWEYFEWNPHHPVQMRDTAGGYSEMIITRPEGPYTHCVFLVLPDREEFATGDLFVQDTESPGLWKHAGRRNDVSKLQNRVLLHPTPIENMLEGLELVSKAVATTDHSLRPVLIVDPNRRVEGNELSSEEVVERLWPSVKEINAGLPPEAQIAQTHILVAPVDKPLRTTAKGTVQRRLVVEDFAKEIEACSRR